MENFEVWLSAILNRNFDLFNAIFMKVSIFFFQMQYRLFAVKIYCWSQDKTMLCKPENNKNQSTEILTELSFFIIMYLQNSRPFLTRILSYRLKNHTESYCLKDILRPQNSTTLDYVSCSNRNTNGKFYPSNRNYSAISAGER